jgi:hypothetical protein
MSTAQATASKATFSRFHDAVNCHDTEVRGRVRCRPGHQNCIYIRKQAGR